MTERQFERRRSHRRRARVSIYVTLPGQKRQRCTTENLSAGGVFIRTDDRHVPQGVTAELVFVIRRGSVARLHRRWAVVTHASHRGAGLMLYNERDLAVLRSSGVSV